jgi:hypothetical protein
VLERRETNMTKAYTKHPGYKHYEVTKTYRLWAPSKEEALKATDNGNFWLVTKSIKEVTTKDDQKEVRKVWETIKKQLGG